MKFVKMEVLIDKGNFSASDEWETLYSQIQQAIASIEWPPGSSSFTIHKQSGKKREERSGVKVLSDCDLQCKPACLWDIRDRH